MDKNVTEDFVMPEGVESDDENTSNEVQTTNSQLKDDSLVEEFSAPERPLVKRPMFAYWEVGGNRYRLKLKTAGIQAIEQKYKQNLMIFLDSMPSLSLMLEVVHAAMQPWHKGVTIKHVQALYDKYTDDGGDHISFWRDVFIEVYKASGFFTQEMLQDLAETSSQK